MLSLSGGKSHSCKVQGNRKGTAVVAGSGTIRLEIGTYKIEEIKDGFI